MILSRQFKIWNLEVVRFALMLAFPNYTPYHHWCPCCCLFYYLFSPCIFYGLQEETLQVLSKQSKPMPSMFFPWLTKRFLGLYLLRYALFLCSFYLMLVYSKICWHIVHVSRTRVVPVMDDVNEVLPDFRDLF